MLVPDGARPDRDEQWPEVLDEQRDPDRQPVDREEVEELHECDAGDPEHREPHEIAPVAVRRDEGDRASATSIEPDARPGAARLA